MPHSSDIVNNALSWEGVRWRHQGRSRKGIDCIGLVIMIAHELNLSDFDTDAYNRSPDGVHFMAGFREHMDRVKIGEERSGDVAVLRDHSLPCHCGILIPFRDTFYLMHAAANRKKVWLEHFTGELKSNRLATFRYRGLED